MNQNTLNTQTTLIISLSAIAVMKMIFKLMIIYDLFLIAVT